MAFEWWQIVLAVSGVLITTSALVILFSVHRVAKLRLKGKSVLVTGGSAGIGLALAKELTKRGAIVVIAARGEDALKSAVAEIQSECQLPAKTDCKNPALINKPLLDGKPPVGYVRMDVSDANSVKQGMTAGLAHVGRVLSPDSGASPSAFS